MTDQEIAVKLVALSASTALPPFDANNIALCLLDEIRTRADELPEQTVRLLLGIAAVLKREHANVVAGLETTSAINKARFG